MNSRRFIMPLLLGLFLIALFSALSACSQVLAVAPMTESQAQINTAVASTLVSYVVETRVAEGIEATAVGMQVAQATATSVPLPTATPVPPTAEPTATPLPAPTDTPAAPPDAPAPTTVPALKISADANTNCRTGPSTRYYIDGYLLKGMTSYVYGRDSSKDWWYIQNPTHEGEFCWVWNGSTTVVGDTSQVPIVAAPEEPDNKPYDYGWYGQDWCKEYVYKGEIYYTCYPPTTWYPTNWNPNYWYPVNWNPYNVSNCNSWITCQCQVNVVNPCKKLACCKPLNKNLCKKNPYCCWK